MIKRPISLPNHVAQWLMDGLVTIAQMWIVNDCLQVLITNENNLLHLSVSHRTRYPTWDEIKEVRYALLPDGKTFAILLPPKAQYVNLHPNCFHLHEVPEMHEG